MKRIRIYQTQQGKEPYTIWLSRIRDKTMKAKIMRRIDRLYLGNEGDFKSVGNGVFELRMSFGPGYRVYYGKYNDVIYILLLGGSKRTQRNDIKLAKQYWQDLQIGEDDGS